MLQSKTWERVRRRLESYDVVLMRHARWLIDLTPSTDTADSLLELETLDSERLRQLWAILTSVAYSQYRLSVGADQDITSENREARSHSRHGNSLAAAGFVKKILTSRGHGTAPIDVGSPEKMNTYLALTKAFVELKSASPRFIWSPAMEDDASHLLSELEQLKSLEPTDYLAADIQEAIAMVHDGVGDQLNGVVGDIERASQEYEQAIACYDAIGRKREARACRLKMVGMIRRLSADFNTTIARLNLLIDESLGDRPSIQRAETRIALAETYSQIGDLFSTNEQLELAEQDIAGSGYVAVDAEDPDGCFRRWVEHAEKVCTEAESFEAELASLLALSSEAFSIRGRMEKEELLSASYMKAAGLFARLGQEMSDQLTAQLVEQSRERAVFIAEFGDPGDPRFKPLEPKDDEFADRVSALARLDASLEELRSEIARRSESGGLMDDLLPEAHRIESEGRLHRLPSAVSTALLLSSDIHLAGQRFTDAIAEARAAFNLPREAQRELTTGLWALDRVIQAHIAQRDDGAVSAVCGEAIALIERHRHNVSAPYSQSAYLQDRSRYYTLGVASAYRCDDFDTLLQRADLSKAGGSLRHMEQSLGGANGGSLQVEFREISVQVEQAQRTGQIEVAKALAARRRTLWDLLSIARAQGAPKIRSPELTVRALTESLRSDQAVLYYYWLNPTVLIIAAFDSQRIIVVKKTVPDDVRENLEEFVAFVQSLRRPSAYIDRVASFSSLLLPDDIKPILTGKRHLLISPHQLLHALPFHALEIDGDLVVRRFAVSYFPNLQCLLRYFKPSLTQKVFAVGIRDFAIKGTTLHPIEESDEEVAAFTQAYKNRGIAVEALPSALATVERLQQLNAERYLQEFTTLHFVTHGADVLGDNPMEAFLWLRDGRLDGLEVASWQLKAELVVLSACHSGQRAVSLRGMGNLASDDIFGLQAAFFAAGAAHVLGALWPAESQVAAFLMSRFHHHRAAGAAPEFALQAAMIEHLDAATIQTRKAYYWAPFHIASVSRPRVDAV
jgi:CHAT domain-containing protein